MFFFVFFLFVVMGVLGAICSWNLQCFYSGISGFFVFDAVWWYLTVLTILLGVAVILVLGDVSFQCVCLVFLSVLSAICCYSVSHALLFWVFYELSILPLLYLLFVESPYSERFIAGWYLMGYVVFTSLPMVGILLYIGSVCGSWDICLWLSNRELYTGYNAVLFLGLGVLFMTKIPLFPFHVWLPIVHAEASSIVSVCLSGYIMKLGLLGICRFCGFLLTDSLLHSGYVLLLLGLTLVYFLSACVELDGKRWLAFLSLSHITIVVVGLFSSSYVGSALGFAYSLGHGLSAGLIFILLWWCYSLAGTRNWNILKSVVGSVFASRCVVVLALCTAASLPTSLQFFSEVLILSDVGGIDVIAFLFFCFYLFASSLVPFFLLGGLLSRHLNVSYGVVGLEASYMLVFVFLLVVSFVGFLLI